MPLVAITPEDVLKAKIVKPDWYEAVILKCETVLNKNKDADNYVTDFKLVGGEFDGVVITVYFSEKAVAFMIPLFEAIAKKKIDPKGAELDTDKLKDKRVQVHVINGTFNNRVQNNIDGYKPSKVA